MTIVKRKHLPGFHVDMSKPKKTLNDKKSTTQWDSEAQATEFDNKAEQATVNHDQHEAENQNPVASVSIAVPEIGLKTKEEVLKPINGLFSNSIGQTKRTRVASAFRRAVFGQEENKRKWNPLAIVSLSLGVSAVALLIAAGIQFFKKDGNGDYGYIFVGASIAVVLAMVSGAIAFNNKKLKVMRGRGLAFGGFFSGVLALLLFFIGVIVMLLMLIVQVLSR